MTAITIGSFDKIGCPPVNRHAAEVITPSWVVARGNQPPGESQETPGRGARGRVTVRGVTSKT